MDTIERRENRNQIIKFFGVLILILIFVTCFFMIIAANAQAFNGKCRSSISLNTQNVSEHFVKKLESIPIQNWYRYTNVITEVCTKIKGKEVVLRDDGSVAYNMTTFFYESKLQNRLKRLFKVLDCEVAYPELDLMLELLRD